MSLSHQTVLGMRRETRAALAQYQKEHLARAMQAFEQPVSIELRRQALEHVRSVTHLDVDDKFIDELWMLFPLQAAEIRHEGLAQQNHRVGERHLMDAVSLYFCNCEYPWGPDERRAFHPALREVAVHMGFKLIPRDE